jgi:hypothetical protein
MQKCLSRLISGFRGSEITTVPFDVLVVLVLIISLALSDDRVETSVICFLCDDSRWRSRLELVSKNQSEYPNGGIGYSTKTVG